MSATGDAQRAVILACTHVAPDARPTVEISPGVMVRCCCACYNASVKVRRDARRAELAARPNDCARCLARPHTWTYAGYKLCGRCKTATAREHGRAMAAAGSLAIFATGLLVDTRAWASAKQDLTT